MNKFAGKRTLSCPTRYVFRTRAPRNFYYLIDGSGIVSAAIVRELKKKKKEMREPSMVGVMFPQVGYRNCGTYIDAAINSRDTSVAFSVYASLPRAGARGREERRGEDRDGLIPRRNKRYNLSRRKADGSTNAVTVAAVRRCVSRRQVRRYTHAAYNDFSHTENAAGPPRWVSVIRAAL